MPSAGASLRVPKYRRHKPSGQAMVTTSWDLTRVVLFAFIP